MNSLKCPQCGHENDLTRVFCQDCGARLERPAGAPAGGPTPLVTSGPGSKLGKSPKIRRDWGGAGLLWTGLRLVILAAILAAVIQMFRMPENLPPPAPANSMQAAGMERMIDTASRNPSSISIGVEEPALNSFLASKLKAVPQSSAPVQTEFERMFVTFTPGIMTVGLQQKVLDWPLVFQLYTVPVRTGGIWDLRVTGARIGRLPIHPVLAGLVSRFLAPAGNALQPEISKLSKVSAIEIKKGQAILTWP